MYMDVYKMADFHASKYVNENIVRKLCMDRCVYRYTHYVLCICIH